MPPPRPKPKAELVPAGAASEPSEPSSLAPEEEGKEQLTDAKEENPQMYAHKRGRQAGDRHGHGQGQKAKGGMKVSGGGGGGRDGIKRDLDRGSVKSRL